MSGDYKSMGFFFPMDNIQELDELGNLLLIFYAVMLSCLVSNL